MSRGIYIIVGIRIVYFQSQKKRKKKRENNVRNLMSYLKQQLNENVYCNIIHILCLISLTIVHFILSILTDLELTTTVKNNKDELLYCTILLLII